MSRSLCNGLNCSSTDLINAHIIPKGFARIIRGAGPNVALSAQDVREARPQLGEFDANILCAACDHKLGVFDDYAIEVCRQFERKHTQLSKDLFEYQNFDGDKFTKFVLAVLWRASISKRAAFENVSFGPYENRSREVLFGAKPLQTLKSFQVLIQRYTSAHLDMRGIYSLPVRVPFMNLNAYGFMLSGFRILAKLDNRPLNVGFAPFVTNSARTMLGLYIEFEKTPEFDRVKDIAASHMIRTRGKSTKI
jgi:hypothetical protein